MKLTEKQLRSIIREELAAQRTLNEQAVAFDAALDNIVSDLYGTTKKIEDVHELAPEGEAKAIVAGLHSDLFNKVAEFRKYASQLKALAKRTKN